MDDRAATQCLLAGDMANHQPFVNAHRLCGLCRFSDTEASRLLGLGPYLRMLHLYTSNAWLAFDVFSAGYLQSCNQPPKSQRM